MSQKSQLTWNLRREEAYLTWFDPECPTEDEEWTFPGSIEVCPECGGKGKVLIDGLRGEAFTAQDFAEDPDFAEGYFGGLYDKPCDYCHGANVVVEVNEERLGTQHRRVWESYQREMADRREENRLRRLGYEF